MSIDRDDRAAWADPTAFLLVAGVLIGAAVQIRLGRLDGLALGMAVLGTALVAAVVGMAPDTRPPAQRWLGQLAGVVLAIHVVSLVPLAREALGQATAPMRTLGVLAIVTMVGLAADQLRAAPTTGAWGRGGLVLAVALLGLVWVASVSTNIDVWHYQEIGVERLLDGDNPYAPGYPNPYDGEATDQFFGAGLSVDGVLQFGFPYPPLSLLLALPGALLGDVRIAHLLAVLVAGGLLLTMQRDSWSSRAGGVLFLTTPMLLPLVQRAWTESFLILALVATVRVLRRGRGGEVIAVGLFLAVKQYAALFVPILLVVGPRWRTAVERWRVLLGAIVVATVVTLPLALWDFGDFLFSVVLLQFRQPFREDAMSLPALADRTLGVSGEALALPGIVLAIGVAMWWSLRRAPRTWAGAVTGVALVMLGFLLFNKQAFTNYYMFVVSAVWLAVALRDESAPPAVP